MEQVIWLPVVGFEDRYGGLREAERDLNLDHGTVMKVMRGRQYAHRGYHLSYRIGGDA